MWCSLTVQFTPQDGNSLFSPLENSKQRHKRKILRKARNPPKLSSKKVFKPNNVANQRTTISPKAGGHFSWIQAGFYPCIFQTIQNWSEPFLWEEGHARVIIQKHLWVSVYREDPPFKCNAFPFGVTASCKNLISLSLCSAQQQDFVCITSALMTFFMSSLIATHAAPAAGPWNSCIGLKQPTQVNCMRKHSNSVHRSSRDTELSPTFIKKKRIAISLIAAKWHTKRKLTIGCDLHSQSDSDFPASLSPCWCQADSSLPISFRPRQPKKALPHRATTSSLFWY